MKKRLHLFAFLMLIKVIIIPGVFGQWHTTAAATENLDSMAYAEYSTALEGLVIETYYIADATDAEDENGGLLEGAVTYRVFADMKPGYRFSMVLGYPETPLEISTTTTFFNNTDRGASFANDIGDNRLDDNTVMLDSWLSVGAGSAGKWAVLKSEDTDGAIENADGLLQNNDPLAGIPISEADGLISGSIAPLTVTNLGLGEAINIFGADVTTENTFSINNGVWAVLSGDSLGTGISGPTPANRILIGQFTTTGTLSYKLNIQIVPLDSVKCKFLPPADCDNPLIVHSLNYFYNLGSRLLIESIGETKQFNFGKTGLQGSTYPSAIRNRAQNVGLKVYPNPAGSTLFADLSAEAGKLLNWAILNPAGSVVLQGLVSEQPSNASLALQVGNLSAGLYVVQINTSKGLFTQRFLKK